MTAEVIYNNNLRTQAKHLASGSLIETDAPTDNNGKGERFSPTDLVATALASCMLTVMGIKAEQMGIDISQTRCVVEKIMASNPRRIVGININLIYPASHNLSEKDLAIMENTARTCPVFYSLHPDIEIVMKIS